MKQCIRLLCFSCIGLFSLLVFLLIAGFRLNTSDSIPKGLYRLHSGSVKKNSLVLFCPDDRDTFREGRRRGYLERGFCKGHYGYLMKQVAAVAGDRVSTTLNGVYVNQSLLPFSKPQSHDGLHRPMKRWQITQYRLKSEEVLTMTNQSPLSFDSRYYGLIQKKQIKGIITPIVIW